MIQIFWCGVQGRYCHVSLLYFICRYSRLIHLIDYCHEWHRMVVFITSLQALLITGQSLTKMPIYNPLATRTQLVPQSTLTHSRQPLGITTSIPFTQGQLQNGTNSQGIQHCPIHSLLLKMQFKHLLTLLLLCTHKRYFCPFSFPLFVCLFVYFFQSGLKCSILSERPKW